MVCTAAPGLSKGGPDIREFRNCARDNVLQRTEKRPGSRCDERRPALLNQDAKQPVRSIGRTAEGGKLPQDLLR